MVNILRDKIIGIIGLARTGLSVYHHLRKINITQNIICWDDNPQARDLFVDKSALVPLSAWHNVDFIIPSPGFPLFWPRHQVLATVKKDCIVMSDLDLLYITYPHKKYIGVTGTNGKSTTCAMVAQLDPNLSLCGNIGIPALSSDHSKQGYVIEVSSYQLEISNFIKFDVSAITNITPDHIDRHGTFENYKNQKLRILQMSKRSVINIDDLDVVGDVNVSISDKSADVYCDTKNIYESDNTQELPYNPILSATHMLKNFLIAYALTKPCDINRINVFLGLPHRMRYLGRIKNIDFYNDSKATNNIAAYSALKDLRNVYWIAGGITKEKSLGPIAQLTKQQIKKAYFYGIDKDLLRELSKDIFDVEVYDDLESCCIKAFQDASKDYDAKIVLSPCCASFDQFKSYEERGEKFESIFAKLKLVE